ncbi:MAG: SGNH/GDSL hydrolase family protein [Polyangiales bacterium]
MLLAACENPAPVRPDAGSNAGTGGTAGPPAGAGSNAGAAANTPATAGGAAATSNAAAGGGSPSAGGGASEPVGPSDEPEAGSGGAAPAGGRGDEPEAGRGGSAAPAGSGDALEAGSGGSAAPAGGDGSEPVGGTGGAEAASGELLPKCKRTASQVIVIGDSYLNWPTHTFPEDLAKEAGEAWRVYAAGGCALGSGGFCTGLEISDQLDQAVADDSDIVAGVMSGGGIDILISDALQHPGGDQCKHLAEAPTLPVCQEIVAAAMGAAETLMQRGAGAGIRDVVYMFYPHVPGGGPIAGENPNAMLDYALPMAKQLCDDAVTKTEGKLRCHFIDLVPVFEGHPDWFADDNIHPSPLGSAAMAKEVIARMKDECIAQPASSGCCEP